MSLNIRPEPVPSKQILRNLVAGCLHAFLGPCTLLEPELPFSGGPMLVLRGRSDVTLISFDTQDSALALTSGLEAWEDLGANRLWFAGRHPELAPSAPAEAVRLVVLMPSSLPGADLLGRGHRNLTLFTFRVLAVNGETALLVEPVRDPADGIASDPEHGRHRNAADAGSGLTEEEIAFLEQTG